MLEAAAGGQCVCGGVWPQYAQQSLRSNSIDINGLCTDVYRALVLGRREDVPVVVLMGMFGGEGKSFYFAPLRRIFGEDFVQATPQPGSFPLLGLEKKKMVLLDEWTFDEQVLPLPLQLLWYEGKGFPINRPQNKEYSGHLLYKGSAPVFATCKERDLGPLINKAQLALQRGKPSEHTMLLRRLRIYRFGVKFPATARHIQECPCCFARLLGHYANKEAASR